MYKINKSRLLFLRFEYPLNNLLECAQERKYDMKSHIEKFHDPLGSRYESKSIAIISRCNFWQQENNGRYALELYRPLKVIDN